jgi:hypothetical protein
MYESMLSKSLPLFGWLSLTLLANGSAADIQKRYHRAVVDAAFIEQAEVETGLNAIHADNPSLVWNEDKSKLLVVTWKSEHSYSTYMKPYDQTSDNPDYGIWVTAAPQVQAMCSQVGLDAVAKPKKYQRVLDRRLKQYLGLDPDWNYDLFVEMWVSPDDMFRPCVDPEIQDTQCNIQFGKELPTVKNIPDYQDFYSDLYFKSFRASEGVPWTGMGYTYDWGNPESDVGASEYILVPEAKYEIKRAVPTAQYCSELH